MELFKQGCEQKQKVRIVIMWDGFDEISPYYTDAVCDLLQALRQTAVEQLWVTTRPHLRDELEDKLQQLSYTMEPFSEEYQVEFLRKFWCLKHCFTVVGNHTEEEFETKLEIFAKHLIRELSQSIGDKDRQFTGIPLQCRMLAEAFDEEFKAFCQSGKTLPEFSFVLGLSGLYETFLNRKYDIRVEEKLKLKKTIVGADEARNLLVETIAVKHQTLALKMFFGEKQVALLHINNQSTSSDEDLTKTGIVQIGDEGKLNFIHRTFADYFVKELTKGSNISQQLQDLLLGKILLEADYRVVRTFIDGMLSRSEPSNEVKKQCGYQINDLGKYGALTVHTTAREGNVHIVGFLLDSLEETGHVDTLVKLFLATDNFKRTAWHMAAVHGNLDILHKMWDRAKDVLTSQHLNEKFFLAKDNDERTAWHMAARKGDLDILDRLWEWAKEILTPQDLNEKLFLATDYCRKTAWHIAAEQGYLYILHKLWDWAKDILTPQDLTEKLFLAKDNDERTAWHMAGSKGNLNILHKLWECAKEVLTPQDLNEKLFLAKDYFKRTAWHMAAEQGNLDILHKLWD
jgi:ankyrin repeat protein